MPAASPAVVLDLTGRYTRRGAVPPRTARTAGAA